MYKPALTLDRFVLNIKYTPVKNKMHRPNPKTKYSADVTVDKLFNTANIPPLPSLVYETTINTLCYFYYMYMNLKLCFIVLSR